MFYLRGSESNRLQTPGGVMNLVLLQLPRSAHWHLLCSGILAVPFYVCKLFKTTFRLHGDGSLSSPPPEPFYRIRLSYLRNACMCCWKPAFYAKDLSFDRNCCIFSVAWGATNMHRLQSWLFPRLWVTTCHNTNVFINEFMYLLILSLMLVCYLFASLFYNTFAITRLYIIDGIMRNECLEIGNRRHSIHIVTYSGFSIHDGTLLHSKSQYTTVKHSRQLFEHAYTSDPHGLGTPTPIEFFQQDLLWQSSNTHCHSYSQKASKHTSGQSIVGLSVHLHSTTAPRRIVHH
jgi:hypothetical protein